MLWNNFMDFNVQFVVLSNIKLGWKKTFLVSSIVDKLPVSQKDTKRSLMNKNEDITLEILVTIGAQNKNFVQRKKEKSLLVNKARFMLQNMKIPPKDHLKGKNNRRSHSAMMAIPKKKKF